MQLTIYLAVCVSVAASRRDGRRANLHPQLYSYSESQPMRTASDRPRTTPVPILRHISRSNADGSYSYGYEAADGTFKLETRGSDGQVVGKYGYVDGEGRVRTVQYGANKHGFQPSGEGITVAPPTLVDETTGRNFAGYRRRAGRNRYREEHETEYSAPVPVRYSASFKVGPEYDQQQAAEEPYAPPATYQASYSHEVGRYQPETAPKYEEDTHVTPAHNLEGYSHEAGSYQHYDHQQEQQQISQRYEYEDNSQENQQPQYQGYTYEDDDRYQAQSYDDPRSTYTRNGYRNRGAWRYRGSSRQTVGPIRTVTKETFNQRFADFDEQLQALFRS